MIREEEGIVHQMEAACAGKLATLCNIDSSLASGEATIAQLELELKAVKDAQVALKMTKVMWSAFEKKCPGNWLSPKRSWPR